MSAFSEYVTSTAFQLRLSKRQIQILERIYDLRLTTASPTVSLQMIDRDGIWGLVSKGIVTQSDEKYGLTPEGELVARLCEVSGLLKVSDIGNSRRARAA